MTIQLKDGFLAPRQAQNIQVTIPSALKRCEETGRLEAFKLNWTPDSDKFMPHIFWDSDVAKVMEGMAYVSNQPDGEKIKKTVHARPFYSMNVIEAFLGRARWHSASAAFVAPAITGHAAWGMRFSEAYS